MGSVVRKVNNVSLNRRFVETDDEEEARKLLGLLVNAHYKTVFDIIDKRRWKHPITVVDPDEITSATFLKAFNKRKQIGEPEKLFEWLVTAAKNLMIDKIRNARSRARRLPGPPINGPSINEGTRLTATDTEQAEADREQIAQILLLLQDQDREIVDLLLDELKPKEIAEVRTSTPEAVEKKWERTRKWWFPIARNLEALINCLPEKRERKIMERYFDRQPFSEITEALKDSNQKLADINPEILSLFHDYAWPGNIRALEGVINRAALLAKGGLISPQHLPETVRKSHAPPLDLASQNSTDLGHLMLPFPIGATLKEIEKSTILTTLARENGNKSKRRRCWGLASPPCTPSYAHIMSRVFVKARFQLRRCALERFFPILWKQYFQLERIFSIGKR